MGSESEMLKCSNPKRLWQLKGNINKSKKMKTKQQKMRNRKISSVWMLNDEETVRYWKCHRTTQSIDITKHSITLIWNTCFQKLTDEIIDLNHECCEVVIYSHCITVEEASSNGDFSHSNFWTFFMILE